MISESRLMLITWGLIFLELKRRYSVMLRLADDLLATKPGENIYNARLNNRYGRWCMFRENEIYVEFYPHKNDNGW